MGFRQNNWATIWSVEPATESRTKVRLSTSRKDKQTGEYVQDFSGFVNFVGKAAASKAATLKERDRIKLGDVEVTTNYVKDRNITYTNYTCFSFDGPDELEGGSTKTPPDQLEVDDGEVEENLPF